MKRTEPDYPKLVLTDEDLLQLQLEIAQRADELAHERGASRVPSDDYACWLEAERDILGGHEALAHVDDADGLR